MRAILVILFFVACKSANGQSIKITPYFPNGVPFQLYAGKATTFYIKNLPSNSVLQMRHGYIKKIGKSIYSIKEGKCHQAFFDTLEIRNNDDFYTTVPFKVMATVMHDTTLYANYGLSCSTTLTKEEFLRNTKLYIMPATANYQVDSFTFMVLLKRGEPISERITGNQLVGDLWQSTKRHLVSGNRFIFEDIYCSQPYSGEKRKVNDIPIRIK